MRTGPADGQNVDGEIDGMKDPEIAELEGLEAILSGTSPPTVGDEGLRARSRYYCSLLKALDLYRRVTVRLRTDDVEPGEDELGRLRSLAGRAIDELGGTMPSNTDLRGYDSDRYGPFMGVSDDGSSIDEILAAARVSPKTTALGLVDPLAIGMALDAERLGPSGESIVGPLEYHDIALDSIGRLLTTTNVGAKVNIRYLTGYPMMEVGDTPVDEATEDLVEWARRIIYPYWRPDNGISIPLVIFFVPSPTHSMDERRRLFGGLVSRFRSGEFSDPMAHTVGLALRMRNEDEVSDVVVDHIDLASSVGIVDVMLKGCTREEAGRAVSMPGILRYLPQGEAAALYKYAGSKGIRLLPGDMIDRGTVARSTWSALAIPRSMGFALGKYGLHPLDLGEMDPVIGHIKDWMGDWATAPVYYVDLETVDGQRVYGSESASEGILRWLDILSSHCVEIALVDTARKDAGIHLVKGSASDHDGVLTIEQVGQLNDAAKDRGVRLLWAGGLTPSQAFALGRLQVFGVFVTTAVSKSVPLDGIEPWDPTMTHLKRPSSERILAVKMLLEAGFMTSRLKGADRVEDATALEETALRTIANVESRAGGEPLEVSLEDLNLLLVRAWTSLYGLMARSN